MIDTNVWRRTSKSLVIETPQHVRKARLAHEYRGIVFVSDPQFANRRPTLRKIARLLGVSAQTVNIYLSDRWARRIGLLDEREEYHAASTGEALVLQRALRGPPATSETQEGAKS